MDLQKKNTLPANKSSLLFSKFDEVRASGGLMPTATLGIGGSGSMDSDDVDHQEFIDCDRLIDCWYKG